MFGVEQLCQERPGRAALPEDHHEGTRLFAIDPYPSYDNLNQTP